VAQVTGRLVLLLLLIQAVAAAVVEAAVLITLLETQVLLVALVAMAVLERFGCTTNEYRIKNVRIAR
jgi:hypothetical protein